MKLVFIDETSDNKLKDYLGISIATIDHTKYGMVKSEFQKILRKGGWNETIEFKGSYLFSAKKGDPAVSIEKRIEIAEKLIDLTSSQVNGRLNFHYLRTRCDPKEQGEHYVKWLPALLKKALRTAPSGPGKNTVMVNYDSRDDIKVGRLNKMILPVLEAKKYVVVESPSMLSSNFHTVGILYADIIGYLAARIDNITNDAQLFEGLSADQLANNGKLQKLKSSRSLISKVRNISKYEVVLKAK